MKVERIKGTRDWMDVYLEDGRVARMFGEMLVDGFVAFTKSLRKWKNPEGEPISEDEKKELIDAIKENQKVSKVKITLE